MEIGHLHVERHSHEHLRSRNTEKQHFHLFEYNYRRKTDLATNATAPNTCALVKSFCETLSSICASRNSWICMSMFANKYISTYLTTCPTLDPSKFTARLIVFLSPLKKRYPKKCNAWFKSWAFHQIHIRFVTLQTNGCSYSSRPKKMACHLRKYHLPSIHFPRVNFFWSSGRV